MEPFDLMEILRMGLEAKQGDAGPLPSEKEQAKILTNFLERKIDFKTGERVTRNEDGENRYRFPRKDQVAMVTKVFDAPMLDERGNLVHGEIAMVVQKPGTTERTVISYAVDFRYYKRRPHAV